MKYVLSIITVLVFFAFAKAQQDSIKVEVPTIVFKAKYGETFDQEDISIKLLDVLEDSRCPSGVDCFWQGQIRLVVEITENNKKTKKEILYKGNNSPILYENEKITFYMSGLEPYPQDKIKTKKEDYKLLIKEKM